MQRCYPVVLRGLLESQGEKHWHQSVNSITLQVIRTYMELNKDMFERISQTAQQDLKQKKSKQVDMKQQWQILHRKHGVAEPESQFPLV